jgi:Na+/phosphate symporter
MLPYPLPDTIGARAATASRSLTGSATGRCFFVGKSPTIGERPSLGIGIGMELLGLGLLGPAIGSMRLKADLLP